MDVEIADAMGSERWPGILGPLLQRLDQVSYCIITEMDELPWGEMKWQD